jgi:hypothetical protein
MKKKHRGIIVMAVSLVVGSAFADTINGININFVNIGNPNNAVDSTSYGVVGYDYRISQTEVSFEQFQASGIGALNYWAGVGQDAPVVNITWHEAAQYCNWLTSSNVNVGAYTIVGGLVTAINRSYRNTNGVAYVLPTEDEWYKAAYFKGTYSDYANGTSDLPTNNVNALYGNGLAGTVWTVGQGTEEQNGTFNMMGNVFEWLETSADEDLTLDGSPENMAFRGGATQYAADRLSRYYRVDGIGESTLDISEFDVSVGMRIVAIPEPGTISLMSLSTISLFFTRTIRRRKLAGKSLLLPIGREHLCDTFSSYEEWEAAYREVEQVDYLAETKVRVGAWFSSAWGEVTALYKTVDKMFWSRMVVAHERKLERKRVIKATLKKKMMAGLDAFLALIMK